MLLKLTRLERQRVQSAEEGKDSGARSEEKTEKTNERTIVVLEKLNLLEQSIDTIIMRCSKL